MDEPRAGAPAWILIITGTIHLVYSLVYGVWTLFPLGLVAMTELGMFMDGTNTLVESIVGLFLLGGVPMVQLAGFCVTLLMSLVVIFGGIRLNVYRSKGIVWLAVLCATGIPLLSLAINAGSALNLMALGTGCLTGCLFGNIPTLFTLVLGLVSSIFAAVTLFDATTAQRYAASR